jgi:hypothetical protein
VSQFRVDLHDLAKMRVLGKAGSFAHRRVTLIRIFDPGLMETTQAPGLKFDDLDAVAPGKSLLFTGHVETDGGVFLTPAVAAGT